MNDKELIDRLNRLQSNPAKAPAYLAHRILANLDERTTVDRMYDWLTAAVWRGLAVAALPAMLGFVLGLSSGELPKVDAQLWQETETLLFTQDLESYTYDEI